MIYYYELTEGEPNEVYGEGDAEVLVSLFQQFKRELLCVYKEDDGQSILVYERV
jgi:hypothetical protein